MFLLKFKKHAFYVFFIYFFNFFVFFKCHVFVVVKNVQNYKYDAFLMGKKCQRLHISWIELVFCRWRLKLQDMKMQDWKMTDKSAGLENA